MFRTIRARLTLWYVVLLALILCVFSGVLYAVLAYSLYEQVDDSLATAAERLTDTLDVASTPIQFAGGEDELASVNSLRAQGYFVRLLDRQGAVLHVNRVGTAAAAFPVDADAVLRGQPKFETITVDARAFRLYSAPIARGGTVYGALQVGESLATVDQTLRQLLLALAVIIPITLLGATLSGMFFAKRALAPMDQITRTAQSISTEDLSQRLNLELPDDELGRLAKTFDAMLDRLDGSFQREREFTANASHELRTPLTIMQVEVDLALERPRTVAEHEGILRELGVDLHHLSALAEDLLTLARADAHRLPLTPEPLNAAQILEAVADEVRPLAASREIRLEVRAREDIVFWADAQKLLRVLFNLVENALKYSEPGGLVSLSAEAKADTLTMEVADQGVGIPPEVLAHIFDRFYRGNPDGIEGTGLGLAIARALVQAHRGTIEVESQVGLGTRFTVRLPMKEF